MALETEFESFIMQEKWKTPVGNAKNGEQLFKKFCSQCHSVVKASKSGQGPNLSGVFGRVSGQSDYNYSPATKKSAIMWNEKMLDEYLSDPKKVIPGTKMVFAGVKKQSDRIDLISFLKSM
jgi:cytochrome c